MTKYQEPIICRSTVYKKFIRQERIIDYKFPADLFLGLRQDNSFEFRERVDYLASEKSLEVYHLSYEANNRFYALLAKVTKRYKRMLALSNCAKINHQKRKSKIKIAL